MARRNSWFSLWKMVIVHRSFQVYHRINMDLSVFQCFSHWVTIFPMFSRGFTIGPMVFFVQAPWAAAGRCACSSSTRRRTAPACWSPGSARSWWLRRSAGPTCRPPRCPWCFLELYRPFLKEKGIVHRAINFGDVSWKSDPCRKKIWRFRQGDPKTERKWSYNTNHVRSLW